MAVVFQLPYSWSCSCAGLPCNRAAFTDSRSLLPAQPALLPCFINLWRQPSINPSPNHCRSSKQIFSDMLLPKINTCGTTCSPHDGLPCRQPHSLAYPETTKIRLYVSSHVRRKAVPGSSWKTYTGTSLNSLWALHFLYAIQEGFSWFAIWIQQLVMLFRFFFSFGLLRFLQIPKRIWAKTSMFSWQQS